MLIHTNMSLPLQFRNSQSFNLVANSRTETNKQTLITDQQASKSTSSNQQAQADKAVEVTNQLAASHSKVERLIKKFKSGKKLTPGELSYLKQHAPDQVEEILRITREREQNELMMRMSPTKVGTIQVQLRALEKIEQTSLSEEEAEVRTRHLQDAVKEYQQTDEYKEKPNTLVDNKKQKRINKNQPMLASMQWAAARKAYKQLDRHSHS